MQSGVHTIFDAALELPENERLILVSRLLATMPEAPTGLSLDDPKLLDELQRRSGDLKDSVSWDQLRSEL